MRRLARHRKSAGGCGGVARSGRVSLGADKRAQGKKSPLRRNAAGVTISLALTQRLVVVFVLVILL